jgi:hypothetical protein
MNKNDNKEYMDNLIDIRSVKFNNSLSLEQRKAYVLETIKDPYCFRCDAIAIELCFSDGGKTLEEVLTQLFIRKKSGLQMCVERV